MIPDGGRVLIALARTARAPVIPVWLMFLVVFAGASKCPVSRDVTCSQCVKHRACAYTPAEIAQPCQKLHLQSSFFFKEKAKAHNEDQLNILKSKTGSDLWMSRGDDCPSVDLWKALSAQRGSLSSKTIEDTLKTTEGLLFDFASDSWRELAMQLLAHASRWAHQNAFASLAHQISKSNRPVAVDGNTAMLGDVLLYLIKDKQAIQDGDTHNFIAKESSVLQHQAKIPWLHLNYWPGEPNFLVDTMFLELLESRAEEAWNPLTQRKVREHIAEFVVNKSLYLLVPVGWISCVTILNQLQIAVVMPRLAKLFVEYMNTRSLKFSAVADRVPDTIEEFLKAHVLDRLAAALDLTAEEVEPQVVWLGTMTPEDSLYAPTLPLLVAHYAQHLPPLSEFLRVMKLWFGAPARRHKEQREALAVLKDFGQAFSFNQLADLCVRVDELVPHDVTFVLPEPQKSFALVHQLCFMNIGDATRFHPYSFSHSCGECHHALLDDLSSSGNQLMQLRAQLKNPHLIAVVLLASEKAIRTVPGLIYGQEVIVPPPRLQHWSVGSFGYASQAACLALPYMSPDNNGVLGAKVFAPFFTPIPAIKFGPSSAKLAQWAAFENKFDEFVSGVRKNNTPEKLLVPLVWL